MKFLIDAQLPPALADWLREAGHGAVHVETLGLRDSSDSEIWTHALQTGAGIITKDEDFAVRAHRATRMLVIIWLRVGNSTNRALRAWFEPRLPGILRLIAQENFLIEVT